MNVDDTTTWLPLDGLRPGFDAGKPPATGKLSGRDLTIAFDDVRQPFDGADEVFEVAPDLFYAQSHAGFSADSLFLDLAFGHALAITTRITEAIPACTQEFRVGTIDGVETRGEPPRPSRDLIGRRVLWVYSADHAYEHVYLSPRRYTWQCLAGPELGLADTDACTTYRLRAGIYVFTWREKVIPCAAVTVADHTAMRSAGALFGLADDGSVEHFTFGARGRLLSATVHPDPYAP